MTRILYAGKHWQVSRHIGATRVYYNRGRAFGIERVYEWPTEPGGWRVWVGCMEVIRWTYPVPPTTLH